MEALKAEADLEVAARRMRELQARWKQVALAPRAQGEAMWRRFKTAQDEVFSRTSAHFAAQNEERAANLARKQALCERAEALSTSTDWVRTAIEIQALQAEWKTIGPVTPRTREGDLGAVPRRLRSVLHAAAGGPEAAQGGVGRQPRAEGSALREGRGAGRFHRVGRNGHGDAPAPGGVEDDRSGPQVEIRGGVAALPHRLRSLLRPLQASRPGGACGQGGTARQRRARAGGAAAGGRGHDRAAGRLVRRHPAPRASAGSRRRSCRGTCSRTWRRAITRRSAGSSAHGRRRSAAPISIPRRRGSGWRSWSRRSRSA